MDQLDWGDSPPSPALRSDARGRLRADPLAQRSVADPRVDARLARLRAALAERGRADDAQRAGRRVAEHRSAGVALAGVDAALREAGADHRLGVEVAVGAGAVGVRRDRDVGLLECGGQVAALRGRAPADDRLAGAWG